MPPRETTGRDGETGDAQASSRRGNRRRRGPHDDNQRGGSGTWTSPVSRPRPTGSSRGRPRDPDAEGRIMQAVLALLTQKGYSGLRIDDVARLSGVAKTTIYRRWSSLAHLVVDTMAQSIGDRSFTPTHDPVADLRRICAMLAESVSAGANSWLAAALDIHRQPDEELRARYRERIIDPPRRLLTDTLTRVRDAGLLNVTTTPEDLTDLLIGGAIYRLAILHTPLDTAQIDAILDGIVANNTNDRPRHHHNPAKSTQQRTSPKDASAH